MKIIKIEEDKLSHYIQTEDKFGNVVNVPVIDVRDGIVERMLGESMVRGQNRSGYIQYNQYHISHKKNK